MKPVAIFCHAATEGAGYFATFLAAHSIPFEPIAVHRGESIPESAESFSGLCFMGGPMSVNDPLPWIERECALIRDAAAKEIPLIGHCLGGQLMSKALGGQIGKNAVKEIGWGKARADDNEIARHWLGERWGQKMEEATVFQWHGETFSIPPGATRILGNGYCANQMFALGPHLGMQCHVEMTPEMIGKWGESWPEEVAGLNPLPESVQTPGQMRAATTENLPAMRQLADQLYSVWIGGLPRRIA